VSGVTARYGRGGFRIAGSPADLEVFADAVENGHPFEFREESNNEMGESVAGLIVEKKKTALRARKEGNHMRLEGDEDALETLAYNIRFIARNARETGHTQHGHIEAAGNPTVDPATEPIVVTALVMMAEPGHVQ